MCDPQESVEDREQADDKGGKEEMQGQSILRILFWEFTQQLIKIMCIQDSKKDKN